MDADRIERALREGPPDEPTYVPGSFRGSSPRSRWFGVASLSVALALVAGIAVGIGLDVLRGDAGDGPKPRELSAADLQGVWQSDPIEVQAWQDALVGRGFTQADIDAFLEHDPFTIQAQYALRFVDDRLVVQAAYDDLPLQTLSSGTFAIGDGTLQFLEVVDGVRATCQPMAAAALDGARLTLRVLALPGCNPGERLASTVFFELVSYSRATD